MIPAASRAKPMKRWHRRRRSSLPAGCSVPLRPRRTVCAMRASRAPQAASAETISMMRTMVMPMLRSFFVALRDGIAPCGCGLRRARGS